jgi:hypothetical protein
MTLAAGAVSLPRNVLRAQIGFSESHIKAPLHSRLVTPLPGEVRLRTGLLRTRYDLNTKKIKEIPLEDIMMPFYRSRGLPTNGKELNGDCLDRCQTGPGAWPGLQSTYWFSAAAAAARWGSDAELRDRLVRMLRELEDTRNSDGFLLASPPGMKEWDNNHSLTSRLRSMIRGLIDVYEATGENLALELARGQADCLWNEIQSQPEPSGSAFVRLGNSTDTCLTPVPHKLTMLDFTSSTFKLPPAFVLLYMHTGDPRYAQIARMCIDDTFVKQLLEPQPGAQPGSVPTLHWAANDALAGRHAYMTMDLLYSMHLLGQLTDNQEYVMAANNAWKLIGERHLYITGGTGSRELWVTGAQSWQLPETLNAQESCAAAHWIVYNHIMLQSSADAKCADHIEQTLYNNLLSAQDPQTGDVTYFLNLTGKDKLFDPPPRYGRHCCEGNLTFALASVPAMVYSKTEDSIYVNLYTPSEVTTTLGSSNRVTIVQETDYPSKGEINIQVQASGKFALNLRIPGWCRETPHLEVNGITVPVTASPGAYQIIEREWSKQDHVLLVLPMGPYFLNNAMGEISRLALRWGPLVLAGTWEDGLPLAEDPPIPEFGVRSLVNRVPYVPTVVIESDNLAEAFRRAENAEPSFEASAVPAALATASTASSSAQLTVRFRPFYEVTTGKYSIWFPAIRRT